MTDSKPESATLRDWNIMPTRRLRHFISGLCRSWDLAVDFKKAFFAFAAVDALSVRFGAVLSSQWEPYLVIA